MTATLDPDRQMMLACKQDCGEHIGGARWHHDDGWMLLEGDGLLGQAGLLIAIIAWHKSTSLKTRP